MTRSSTHRSDRASAMARPSMIEVLRDSVGVIAAVGALSLASIRVVTSFFPQVWWANAAVDSQVGLVGFGPSGAAVIDWLSVGVLGVAVIDRLLRGGRVHWVMLTLWVIGAVFALWQGWNDFESLRIGGHWLGALALGLAALHVAQIESMRRLLIAGAIALLIPLAAQGLFQVTIGHAETVANYEANKDEVLRAQGIEPGSINHRKFEERLYQVEATGRLGFSNVYGSIVMMLTLLGAGVTAGLLIHRPRDAVGYLGLGVTLTGIAVLLLSFSKGATLAFLAAGAATAVTLVLSRWLRWGAGWWRIAAYGAIALGMTAIVTRGVIGEPETAAGERSLLFRYHYVQAAAQIAADNPVAGVGPGLFKTHYSQAKSPLNPEDVADPHNVFASYVASLGIGGLAWSLVVLMLVWHAGGAAADRMLRPRDADVAVEELDEVPCDFNVVGAPAWARPARLAIASGAIVFMTEYAVQFGGTMGITGLLIGAGSGFVILIGTRVMTHGLDKPESDEGDEGPGVIDKVVGVALWVVGLAIAVWLFPLVGVWVVGAAGFIGLATMLMSMLGRLPRASAVSLFAAAIAMLLHSQIEMTLVVAGSAPLALVVLGVASARPLVLEGDDTPDEPDESVGASASDASDGPPTMPPAPRTFAAAPAVIGLVVAGCLGLLVVLGLLHLRPVLRHESLLERAAAEVRLANGTPEDELAAVCIAYVDAGLPPDDRLARDLARLHFDRGRSDAAMQTLAQAREAGNRLAMLWNAEARLADALYRSTEQPVWRDRALAAMPHALAAAPYDLESTRFAADLAWDARRLDLAKRWYERVIELNEQAYLDPNKPLREGDLKVIRERLATLDSSGESPTETPQ